MEVVFLKEMTKIFIQKWPIILPKSSTLLQHQIYSKAEVSAREKGKYDTLQSNSFQLRPHSE